MSTKGHHATRILVYLAQSPGRIVAKSEIGEAEHVSPGYVQQLMSRLTDAGLVRSHRGKDGGFSLARPAEDISVRDVLEATEGRCIFAPCLNGATTCPQAEECPTRPVWVRATDVLNDLFGSTSVADLVADAESRQKAAGESRLDAAAPVEEPAVR